MAEALYCNTTTDLQSVEPNIHSYSSNRLVMGWSNTFRTNASTNVYYKGGVGHADQVYFNGKEGFSSHVESLDWTELFFFIIPFCFVLFSNISS